MNGYGYVDEALLLRQPVSTFTKMTVGEVIDTNDPQQMGRLRVLCPALGDSVNSPLKNIPWATYVTPFGGIVNSGSRGRGENQVAGPTSYGMWNIPKVGSTVLIACIDGDTRFRVWLGCIHGQFFPHTLPHGRFIQSSEKGEIGPVSSTEEPIQPLHSELTLAFTKSKDTVLAGVTEEARKSYEFRTRGADFSASAINAEIINSDDSSTSTVADDQDTSITEADGTTTTVTQGYSESRVDPPLSFAVTNNKNYDSQTYGWTTPGFHSVSMDDRQENCRIRIRSTHGHQIIMDDTNERMYISTPQGDTWIELDEKGNIDIYGKRNVSIHAEKDINMTTDKTFRVKAKEGIHLISEDEVRIHAKGGDGLNIKSNEIHMESSSGMHIKSDTLYLNSASDANILIGGSGYISSNSDMYLNGGPNIHLNPGSGIATSAESSKEAFWTSRVPEHEPWPRVMTKTSVTDQDSGNTHTNAAEYSYNNKNVGRVERGESLNRNSKWHR